MIRFATVSICVLASPMIAHAGIAFTAAGDDLQVDFTAAVVFDVNAARNTSSYFIGIENAYTSDQGSNAAVTTGDSSMTLNAAPSSIDGNLGGTNGIAIGMLGPRDLFLGWSYPVNQPLAIGDTVTISAGTRVIPGFIGAGGIVPDSAAVRFDLILGDASGAPLSTAVSVAAVPEPPAFLVLGLFGIGIATWQWKQKERGTHTCRLIQRS